MEELLRSRLSATSTAFIRAEGISRAKLGSLILNDNTFFRRVLDEEHGFTVRIYDRVIEWMANHWPTDATWPTDVPRPPPALIVASTSAPDMREAATA